MLTVAFSLKHGNAQRAAGMAVLKVVQISSCGWFDCVSPCVFPFSLYSLTEQNCNKCFPVGFVERMKKTSD